MFIQQPAQSTKSLRTAQSSLNAQAARSASENAILPSPGITTLSSSLASPGTTSLTGSTPGAAPVILTRPNAKDALLDRLHKTYCRLRPSAIEGVGVFAIRDIPKGINPFEGTRKSRWHKFHVSEFEGLDPEVLKMIDDFVVIEKDQTVYVPECGLNGLDPSFFLNNSGTPNLMTIDGGATFVALRDIKKGEELSVAYETYDHKYEKKNGC